MGGIDVSRRAFLKSSLALANGMGRTALARAADTLLWRPQECVSGPPVGGELLGLVPLGGTRADLTPLDRKLDRGLDARLFADLSTLDPDRLITDTERFYIRTEYPDQMGGAQDWRIRIHGLVNAPSAIDIRSLREEAEPLGPYLMECAGNNNPANFGLMSVARWSGVSLTRILSKLELRPSATRALVSGFDGHSHPSLTSAPGAAWVFTLDQLAGTGAFFAVGINGQELPRDHGWPVRLMVPRWYGCASIKWVNDVQLVDDRVPAPSQMKEFAARTHQAQAFDLARDYLPASIDTAAVPVRVERWQVSGQLLYRVVGVVWGGDKAVDAVEIRFNAGQPYHPVRLCRPHDPNVWSLWAYEWRPPDPGRYQISLRVPDTSMRTRRLDLLFYTRSVWIDAV